MLNWFKKKKKSEDTPAEAPKAVKMYEMNYHPKVILAWAKAVEGNKDLLLWLSENGFQELSIACSAIRLKDEAREWLIDNGYPHLMAMINAAEGNQKALQWLYVNKLDLLYHMAQAIDNETDSWEWLKRNATQDIFILAASISKVKNQIEERHNDIHSFGSD